MLNTETPNTLADALVQVRAHFEKRAEAIKWRSDPVGWCEAKIGTKFWSKQAEVAEALVTHKRVAVKSGHAVGKTWLAASLMQWWIETHIGEDVIVISTAPTYDQIVGILWENIRRSHKKYSLSGVVSEATQWKADDRTIVGIGRKPADSNMQSFQGRHYKYSLIVIDEACGISSELFTAIDAIATTDTCRVLAIGNPVDPNTTFGNIFLGNGGRGLDAWHKMTISVLDSPNFTGEQVSTEIQSQLSSRQWVEDKKQEVGEESNDFKSRVLGEFPETSEDSLFPIQLVYSTFDNEIDVPDDAINVLGVDVARYGSDSTSVLWNHGGVIEILDLYKNANGPVSAQKIHRWAVEKGVTEVRVDAAGPGASVIDHLYPLSTNFYQVVEMNGSGATPDPKKWLNVRAFWHDHVKQQMLHHLIRLPSTTGNPHAQRLFDELVSCKYKINLVHQSIQIESKEEIRRDGRKSPDLLDGLCYAMAPIDMDSPLAEFGPGDLITMDAYEMLEELGFEGRTWAISPY